MQQLNSGAGIFRGEDAGQDNSPWGTVERGEAVERRRIAQLAATILAARRRREEMFGADLFADPAWDMLLDLFVNEASATPVHVSGLCSAAAVPTTTALRWIGTLAERGLIERRPTQSGRKVEIRLTRRAYRLVFEHLRDTACAVASMTVEEDEAGASED